MGILADWQIKDHVKIDPFVESQCSDGKVSFGLSSYGYDARVGYKFKVFTPVNCAVVDPKNFDPKTFVDIDVTPEEHDWQYNNLTSIENYRCQKCGSSCYDREAFMNPCVQKPDHVLIPPNSFALAESLETFTIPRDCLTLCSCKSTYARCGLAIPTTILEPEWTGTVTLEIANLTPLPAKVYAGEGIMQVLFFRTDGHNEAVFNAVRRLVATNSVGMGPVLSPSYIEELLHAEMPRGTCRVSYADRKGRYQAQDKLTLPFVEKEKYDDD